MRASKEAQPVSGHHGHHPNGAAAHLSADPMAELGPEGCVAVVDGRIEGVLRPRTEAHIGVCGGEGMPGPLVCSGLLPCAQDTQKYTFSFLKYALYV